jgi:thioredoxin reductase (NADPH)
MAEPNQSIIATRGAQMFPRLTDDELGRLARFGEPATYAAGAMIARPGEVGPGLLLILSGKAEVSQQSHGAPSPIVTHERGNFMGELAQLSGRPSLVEVKALEDIDAIAVPPDRLRAMLIAEAELGERIMRALILRRVGLIEAGAGPVIVGSEADADVLRLVNFLRRNGHPYQSPRASTRPRTVAVRC